jgi:hypothetical protein
MNGHTIRHERRRGFQPPWYTVTIYTCPKDGKVSMTLRQNWHGPTPRGGVYCPTCGEPVAIG